MVAPEAGSGAPLCAVPLREDRVRTVRTVRAGQVQNLPRSELKSHSPVTARRWSPCGEFNIDLRARPVPLSDLFSMKYLVI